MKNEQKYYNPSIQKSNTFSIINGYPCPICKFGYKPKKVFYVPLKDKNGIWDKNKALRVIGGGRLHKELLDNSGKLPSHLIVEE